MSDLIRREDVVKAMNEALAVGDISRAIANDILNDIPSAEPEQKWIPVSEALPEDMGRLLVTIVRSDGSKRVRSGHYYKGHSCEDYEKTDGLILVQVWDWMTK